MSCTWHINSLDKSKCWSKFPTKAFLFSALQIMKVTDAISREQLIQIAASFGIGNATPVFSMVNVRAGHCFQQPVNHRGRQSHVEQCWEGTYLVHIRLNIKCLGVAGFGKSYLMSGTGCHHEYLHGRSKRHLCEESPGLFVTGNYNELEVRAAQPTCKRW